ncbi:copper chaperone [Arthrobacter sp. UYCu512]|uniref:heavy-metal-associated domain-containing protein n=1 Tax=Arthrobacter sp. UYCu512 TaxID=3156338 RepID=UPI0033979BC9
MCGTEARTELPLAATGQGGCSCCAPAAATPQAPIAEGAAYLLEGLTCGHCVQTVEKAVSALHGVESVAVELVSGGASRLTVAGTAGRSAVEEAVTDAGYSLTASK